MDVTTGRSVHIHVDHGRAGSRMADCQTRLLNRLPHGSIFRAFPGIDVTPWLQPSMEPAVTVEHHPPRADHDGRRGEMGRIGRLVEGTGQAVELGRHDLDRERLPSIDWPMGSQYRQEVASPAIGRGLACLRAIRDRAGVPHLRRG